MKIRSFTLIELLIVVAIIAILAAIAVPNFIEAQTRSKVARGKADMRTEATAMESYMVDWNTYPPYEFPTSYHNYPPIPSSDPGGVPGVCALTTPVAYITSLPRDVFPMGPPEPYFVTMSGSKGLPGSNCRGGTTDGSPDTFGQPWPKDMYLMVTRGPDHSRQITPQRFPNKHDSERTVHVYDASNGSVSVGDIFRWVCPARYNIIYEVGYDPGKDIDPTDGGYERWKTGGY